ncbi:MAG: DinB family protein [Planctomycetota bacterium]
MSTDALLDALARTRRQTLALVEDLDDEQLFQQPASGMNHAAWTLGHLFGLDAYLADLLSCDSEARLDQQWIAVYGPASAPLAGGAEYEPKQTYLDRLDAVRSVLMARIGRMSDDDLKGENPDDRTREHLPTIRHWLDYALWHEAYHAGQLSAWRRVLGLPGVGVSFMK